MWRAFREDNIVRWACVGFNIEGKVSFSIKKGRLIGSHFLIMVISILINVGDRISIDIADVQDEGGLLVILFTEIK